MTTAKALFQLAITLTTGSLASAWVPERNHVPQKTSLKIPDSFLKSPESASFFDPIHVSARSSRDTDQTNNFPASAAVSSIAFAAGPVLMLAFPTGAEAAVAGAPNSLAAALGAYGHFVSLLAIVAATMVERLTIKPGMSKEDEDVVVIADIMLGVFGTLLVYSGYQRAVNLEKGWEFYSHEPMFWVKMTLFATYGASTFFNTTKIIQRSIARRNGQFTPMSERLADRMVQLTNVGLLALAAIPFSATLMARGVTYNQDFPWQVGAGVTAVSFLTLGFKYIREALQFEDDVLPETSE